MHADDSGAGNAGVSRNDTRGPDSFDGGSEASKLFCREFFPLNRVGEMSVYAFNV